MRAGGIFVVCATCLIAISSTALDHGPGSRSRRSNSSSDAAPAQRRPRRGDQGGSDAAAAPTAEYTVRWQDAPIIITGVGGSGTRGVVDMLNALGFYLAPAKGTKARGCLNGVPQDNHCMTPQFKKQPSKRMSMPDYSVWLEHGACVSEDLRFAQSNLELNSGGVTYMESVPLKNQQVHRWGFKHPKEMYRLNLLSAFFPGMLLIHVLRNPLDMAASYTEHLQYRCSEFSSLHGGAPKAAAVMKERCDTMHEEGTCALTASELRQCSDLPGYQTGLQKGDSLSGGWRCMEMMLWADINVAVHAFGDRCLRPEQRYIYWHGEDDYGLRGLEKQRNLQLSISRALNVSIDQVASVFQAPHEENDDEPKDNKGSSASSVMEDHSHHHAVKSSVKEGNNHDHPGQNSASTLLDRHHTAESPLAPLPDISPPVGRVATDTRKHRRLEYGKYRSVVMAEDKLRRCALSARADDAMALFEYDEQHTQKNGTHGGRRSLSH